jgi:hypothetical protein
MRDAFGRANKARAKLDARRAHFEIDAIASPRPMPPATNTGTSARQFRQDLLRQHGGRDRADMAAGLHPFDDQRIDAGTDQLLRQRQRRGKADHLGARSP